MVRRFWECAHPARVRANLADDSGVAPKSHDHPSYSGSVAPSGGCVLPIECMERGHSSGEGNKDNMAALAFDTEIPMMASLLRFVHLMRSWIRDGGCRLRYGSP